MCLDNSGAARALAGTRAARPIFTIKEANKAMSGFPQAHLHIIRLFPINLSFYTILPFFFHSLHLQQLPPLAVVGGGARAGRWVPLCV